MSQSIRCLTLIGLLVALCLLMTAPAQATHPRPKAASPVRLALIPAYSHCAAANRTHGPPLAFPSCNPPQQASGTLTVGTPDSNGATVNSTGYVAVNVRTGNPGPPDDQDVGLSVSLTDVRVQGTLADYSGELRAVLNVRITDHFNATSPGGGVDPATVTDIDYPVRISCAITASTSVGSTCQALTTFDAVIPGSGAEGRREVWDLGQVQVFDGGADGDGDTTADNTIFARPGVFIP
jgi:hypothetical protein